jgi:hypothetical protein
MNVPERFAMVPEGITFNPELSDGATRLYDALAQHADREGRCRPGQERLAPRLGWTVRRLQRHLAELVTARVVQVLHRGRYGAANEYLLIRTPAPSGEPPMRTPASPYEAPLSRHPRRHAEAHMTTKMSPPSRQKCRLHNDTSVVTTEPVNRVSRTELTPIAPNSSKAEIFTAKWQGNHGLLPDMRKVPTQARQLRLIDECWDEFGGDEELLAAGIRRCAADEFYLAKGYGWETFCRKANRFTVDRVEPLTPMERDRETIDRRHESRGERHNREQDELFAGGGSPEFHQMFGGGSAPTIIDGTARDVSAEPEHPEEPDVPGQRRLAALMAGITAVEGRP